MLQFSCCNCTGFQVNIQLASTFSCERIGCNCTGFQVNIQLDEQTLLIVGGCNCTGFQVNIQLGTCAPLMVML